MTWESICESDFSTTGKFCLPFIGFSFLFHSKRIKLLPVFREGIVVTVALLRQRRTLFDFSNPGDTYPLEFTGAICSPLINLGQA
jgi:hypothetical protein